VSEEIDRVFDVVVAAIRGVVYAARGGCF
jgi:hypothetical protein